MGRLTSCWAVLCELCEGRAQGCLAHHPASWLRTSFRKDGRMHRAWKQRAGEGSEHVSGIRWGPGPVCGEVDIEVS